MANYRTNEKKSYKPREVSKPIKGSLNSFFDKNNRLKVKNSKGFVSDVVLDSTLEDFNVVNTLGITESTTVIEALELLTTNIPTDVNQLTDIDHLLYETISTTYENLIDLRNAAELEVGKKYLITDYVPVWNIFDGGTMNIEEYQAGIGEMLIVTAATSTTIFKEAISTTYPSDTIYYSLDLIDDRDIGFGDGAGNPIAIFKGMIYYRKDTIQNVETHYDFRNIKFRRWAVDAVAYDNGAAYIAKDVCKSVDGKIYKCIADTTGEGDPTVNTADWVLWLDITADAFVSWTSDKTQFSIGDITTDNLIINNVTAGVDYNDFYTFGGYYNWVKNVSIGMIDLECAIQDYSYATQLNNVVFKTIDDYYTLFSSKLNDNTFNITMSELSFCNFLNVGSFSNNLLVYDTTIDELTISIFSYSSILHSATTGFRYSKIRLYKCCINDGVYNVPFLNLTRVDSNSVFKNIICNELDIRDLAFINATIISTDYSKTIYKDKTDGVKLSYMDGGVMQVVDVTA